MELEYPPPPGRGTRLLGYNPRGDLYVYITSLVVITELVKSVESRQSYTFESYARSDNGERIDIVLQS